MFYESAPESVPYFRFEELERVPGFVHAFSSRRTDDFSGLSDPGEAVFHKDRFLQAIGISPDRTLQSHQIHSTRLLGHSEIAPGHRPDGDGLVIDRAGLFGVIRTADCVPALIVDPATRRVGLIHAGWKGTAGHILGGALKRMLDHPETRASGLIVAIGPSIRSCCYEVGDEVRQRFELEHHDCRRLFQGRHLDLAAANRSDAEAAGVGRIIDCGVCTSCRHTAFYSHRRNRDTGRMWMVAGFRSDEEKMSVGAMRGPHPH